jgi:hypothetical protein
MKAQSRKQTDHAVRNAQSCLDNRLMFAETSAGNGIHSTPDLFELLLLMESPEIVCRKPLISKVSRAQGTAFDGEIEYLFSAEALISSLTSFHSNPGLIPSWLYCQKYDLSF